MKGSIPFPAIQNFQRGLFLKKLRTKCWVILCRRLSDNMIFGYCSRLRKLNLEQVSIYHSFRNPKYHDEKTKVDALALQHFIDNELKSHDWYDPDKYEIFVSRVGSKKCPIKVNWKSIIKNGSHRPTQRSSANYSVGLVMRETETQKERSLTQG